MRRFAFPITATIPLCVLMSGCNTPLNQALYDLGFTENNPPEAGFPTALTLVSLQKGPLGYIDRVEFFCFPGKDYPVIPLPPVQTESIDSVIKLSESGKLVVDPAIIKDINTKLSASGSAQTISNIKYSIKNASVVNADPNAILTQIVPITKKNCDATINAYKAIGDVVPISSVFVADVDYSVETASGASLDLTGSVPNILETSLNAKVDRSSNTVTSGRQLVYGYKWPTIPMY
jgi:hypothetical protein